MDDELDYETWLMFTAQFIVWLLVGVLFDFWEHV